MENFTYGLDIATALSVIAAAGAFIWNSVVSDRNERKERHKQVINEYVFQVADSLLDESIKLFGWIGRLRILVKGGQTSADLNEFLLFAEQLPYIYKSRIEPLDKTYGNGSLALLGKKYKSEIEESIARLTYFVDPETDESWDFDEVMLAPLNITEKYITLLFEESEKYIESL